MLHSEGQSKIFFRYNSHYFDLLDFDKHDSLDFREKIFSQNLEGF